MQSPFWRHAGFNQRQPAGDWYVRGGAATGVAINLMTADKADLPLHGSNSYIYPLSSTADNTLNFYAQYISTAASVTAGPANSVANFSVVYN